MLSAAPTDHLLGVPMAGEPPTAELDEDGWDDLEADLGIRAAELDGLTEEQLLARIQELEAAAATAPTATEDDEEEEEGRVQALMASAELEPAVQVLPLVGPSAGGVSPQTGEMSASASTSALTSGNLELLESRTRQLELERNAEELRQKELAREVYIQRLEREKQSLQHKNQALETALITGQGLSQLDSRHRAAADRAAAKTRREAKKAELAKTSAADLERRLHEAEGRIAAKQRGVDVVIAMDLTGSMSGWIESVKAKALEILDIAPSKFPDAITRLAFVGYRDYGREACSAQHVVVDFVDKSQVHKLMDVIRPLHADGGGNAEDVAGMLKKVTELSWQSTTRLLIHFGDAPCHGIKYHGGYARNGADSYPGGDPTGLVPEELLRQLICNRVDYHFARICEHTDMMCGIFQKVYEEALPGGAAFETHDYGSSAHTFMDVVVRSLTSSMRRSMRCSSSSSSSSYDGFSDVLPEAFANL